MTDVPNEAQQAANDDLGTQHIATRLYYKGEAHVRTFQRVTIAGWSPDSKRPLAVRALAHLGVALLLVVCSRAEVQIPTTAYEDAVLRIQRDIASGDLDAAHTLLTAAMQNFPANGGLENLQGVIAIQQGHADEARQAFSEAIAHSPKLASAYLNLARLLLQGTDDSPTMKKRAFKLYQRVEELDPANLEASYQAANLLLGDRQYAASLAELKKLSAAMRERADVEALTCADQFGLGHPGTAEQVLRALMANPERTEQDAFTVLASLRAAHRADLVDKLFSAVQDRQPLSAAGVRILGLAQEAEGRFLLAQATLERAFAMSSNTATALVDLTRIALASGDDHAALSYLAHARVLAPRDPDLAFEFGLICVRLNLLGEALKAVGEALALAPESPEYNLEYGALTTLSDDPSRGLPYLQKYHALRPNDPEGDLALGAAFFGHHEYAKAEPWLQQAKQDASTAAAAHYYLGSMLHSQAQEAQAILELSESARLKPDQADVHAQLAQAYMATGKLSEAQTQLDKALALDADSYAANFALVRLYERTSNPRRAEQLRRFQQLRERQGAQYSQAMRVIEARPLPEVQAIP